MAEVLVVGVDGTVDSLAALRSAADMATESGAELVVVHVHHESAISVSGAGVGSEEAAMREALDEVEKLSRERASDVLSGREVNWRFEVTAGDPASELIAAACNHHASTIVVGGRSHGIVGGLLVGSVAQKLVRHSPVSVLVVRDGHPHPLEVPSSAADAQSTGV
jgi:nucleotide-binding universal stress UspA family protein